MALPMSRPWRDPATGSYYLRKRVPTALEGVLGRRTVKRSLGTKNAEEAKRRFPAALAKLEREWSRLDNQSRRADPPPKPAPAFTEREAHGLAAPLARKVVDNFSENPSHFAMYWTPALHDKLWTLRNEVDEFGQNTGRLDIYEAAIDGAGEGVKVASGDKILLRAMQLRCREAADDLIDEHGLVLNEWDRFTLMKAVAAAFQRAAKVLSMESMGIIDWSRNPPGTSDGSATRPGDGPSSRSVAQPTTITGLLEGWWREAQAAGRKESTYRNYRGTVQKLISFARHDDASRVSASDILAFKDHRLQEASAKTVKDGDLSALKAIFQWAVANRKIAINPAAGITIRLGRPVRNRPKGFTEPEAHALLAAALSYQPSGAENPRTSAAKRWVPWLCAFTGARVGEVAQLRKQDVFQSDGIWAFRITPAAGRVKTNVSREVAIHPQVIELGFVDFVHAADAGYLFMSGGEAGNILGKLKALTNRLAAFARETIKDENVAPNHGWRHRFKTVGMEAEIPARVLDAIEGHSPRSEGERYGDVTLRTMSAAMEKFPRIKVGGAVPSAPDRVTSVT